MTAIKHNNKDFLGFCLKHFFGSNHSGYQLAMKEFESSKTNAQDFLNQFLLKRNRSEAEIELDIRKWERLYETRNTGVKIGSGVKKILIGLVVLFILYFGWQWLKPGPKAAKPPDTDRLYVITTSSFNARDVPPPEAAFYRERFYYGDTVRNMHDTTSNHWLKFMRNGRALYAPEVYLAPEYLFRRYDSLFAGYHYQRGLENIKSQMMKCAYEFIQNSLQSSTVNWYIPLQSEFKKPVRHAVLTIPSTIAPVHVIGEGQFARYHLLMLSRRENVYPDSVNHYLLLLELLPDGSVIKKEDFPLEFNESSCFFTVESADKLHKGELSENIYCQTSEGKKLKLVWQKEKQLPGWEWLE